MPQPFKNLTESLRVQLQPDEAEAVQAIAQGQDRSVSWVIREAVREYLTRRVPEPEKA